MADQTCQASSSLCRRSTVTSARWACSLADQELWQSLSATAVKQSTDRERYLILFIITKCSKSCINVHWILSLCFDCTWMCWWNKEMLCVLGVATHLSQSIYKYIQHSSNLYKFQYLWKWQFRTLYRHNYINKFGAIPNVCCVRARDIKYVKIKSCAVLPPATIYIEPCYVKIWLYGAHCSILIWFLLPSL